MSEYLRRLARRGAGAPGPKAVAPPETIAAFAFGDTRGALDGTGAEPGGDRDASTRPPSPKGERADGVAARTATPSAAPDRSAASGSTAEVTEPLLVPPRRLRPYEAVVEAISRRDADGPPASTPDAGAAPASAAAAPSRREADAGRASAADAHRSTLSAPSHPVDRAGPAMPPARGLSGPDPSDSRGADVAAIRTEIGSEGPHTTELYRGRGSPLDDDDTPDSAHFATEPHIETKPRVAPTASPNAPDPRVILAPAATVVVATPPTPAPVPQAPPLHPTGPQVSVSIGRITVQSEAPHPTPTELPRSPQRSRFSSMTLARRHVDRRWY